MNWYKKAQDLDFSKWWTGEIQRINDTRAVYSILRENGVSTEDIKSWQEDTHPSLRTFDLSSAARKAKQYVIKRDERGRLNKEETNESIKNNIKEKLSGQPCFLNGYPAKIEPSLSGVFAKIVSNNSYTGKTNGDIINMRSWKDIEKNYPYYYGNVYQMKDTEDEIKQRIEKEKQRPAHPVQISLLRAMYRRLKEIKDEKESIDFQYSKENESPRTLKRHIKPQESPQESPYEYIQRQKEEQGVTPQ